MLDSKMSNDKIFSLIQKNNQIIKSIINEKNEEINELREALALSESGKQNAENMVAQIKNEVSEELKKAYNSGYNAALVNTNPNGGTTMSQEESKTLTLTNQN